jgi:hypothetical protein
VRARSETPRIEPCCPISADTNKTCFNYNKPGYFTSICLESYKRNLKEIKEKKLYKLEKKKQEKKNLKARLLFRIYA